ncbi:septal ring lytic transglycosylase RlpA family protein [Bdellovibrio sp. HCB288]|uniref:septal ring lytic transglycosylase RlpA family protein n=1 Tax=Bdellovibrio sp. HCB288 TaxID=3394355 RepID=UPI0039B3FCD0
MQNAQRIFIILLTMGLSLPSCATPLRVGSTATGKASYYGESHNGNRTASGETFDMDELTAAHRTLPMGSRVKVSSLTSGKSVTVRINDRGPYKKGRIIDVSEAAAKELDMIKKGVDRVKIEVLSIPGK